MAAAGERHLRRAAPSAPATGFTNYEARKPPVNSQNLPLLLQQNFKRLATLLQPPRTSLAHPSPKYGYFPQTFDFSPQTSRCDTPLQTRKSEAIAKEFLTDLPPLLFATPRTPLAVPIPETAKTRAFSRKVRFIPQTLRCGTTGARRAAHRRR